MMTMDRRTVLEADDEGAARNWRTARIAGWGIGSVALIGVGAGFVVAHLEEGGRIGTTGGLILGGIVLAALICLWQLARAAQRPSGEAPLTPKERLNRNILIASAALGGIMGAAVAIASGEGIGLFSPLSDAPLPPLVALAMVLVTGVLVPALSFVWHRSAIDEQEVDAYKTGALYGLYVYMIGAPVWWFAWRGGFVPEPNGVIIFFVTVTTVGVVWMWKKYR